MKKGAKILLIILAAVAVLILAAFIAMKHMADKALLNMVYEDVDMNQTADGTYYGETDAGMVYVKVAVTVENHKIKAINILEHKNGRGAPAEAITGPMIENNSCKVDDVSGATLSSRTIKSAVSKALKASCG